ncbi:MAG TPA: FKBP-type peptidyl-prolyl cis-trans isomerase [Thermoanaerobaculia bacterium]|nr:FKBP-type peptidyl-prolyl cis-trans isomerase [Thermoanaerobaculia bacterium]
MRKLIVAALLALPLFAEKPTTPPAELKNPPAEAERLENGLITMKLADGTGTKKPAAGDLLRVRYTVWKSNGTLVQHVEAPQTVMIGVAKMIPGWGLAAQKMVEGERRRVWIPASLSGGKLQGEDTMMIDTELVEILDPPTQAPADVAAPPDDAMATPTGLTYKVLRPGSGTRHPNARSTVTVHYTGWSTDGKMFDSSILRGQPATFALNEVIKGWTEGLQLMVTGEKTRFWIPARLAYASDRSRPQGMLVFDIELVAIN